MGHLDSFMHAHRGSFMQNEDATIGGGLHRHHTTCREETPHLNTRSVLLLPLLPSLLPSNPKLLLPLLLLRPQGALRRCEAEGAAATAAGKSDAPGPAAGEQGMGASEPAAGDPFVSRMQSEPGLAQRLEQVGVTCVIFYGMCDVM